MATVIQIKRTGNITAPSTSDIIEAELAYSEDKSNNGSGAKLYIGSLDSTGNPTIDAIGGKYYTNLANQSFQSQQFFTHKDRFGLTYAVNFSNLSLTSDVFKNHR